MFVDQRAGGESLERKGRVQRMRLAVRDRVRVDPAGARCGLEAAGAPPAIDEQVLDRRQSHDRRRIRRYVDNTGPGAKHVRAAEDREQLAGGGELVLDHVWRATLRI